MPLLGVGRRRRHVGTNQIVGREVGVTKLDFDRGRRRRVARRILGPVSGCLNSGNAEQCDGQPRSDDSKYSRHDVFLGESSSVPKLVSLECRRLRSSAGVMA